MADTVHQMLVQLSAKAFFALFLLLYSCLFLFFIDSHRSAFNLLKQLLRLVNAIRHRHKQHLFPCKSCGLYIFVRSHNDAVRLLDLLCGQTVFHTGAAVGFHLDGQVHLRSRFFQCLCCHIGMRDTGRAGGHCQHPIACFFFHRLLLAAADLLRILFLFKSVDYCHKLLCICCAAQGFDKFSAHQQDHQSGKNLQMQVAVEWCCNHKKQIGGLSVHCTVVHALCQCHRCQRRSAYCV